MSDFTCLSPKKTSSFRHLLLLFPIALIAMLAACQPSTFEVYHSSSPQFDETKYQKFSVKPTINCDTQFVDLVNQGIINTLTDKGYTYSEKGELSVLYQIDIIQGEQIWCEPVPENGNIYTQTTLEAVYEAKILVNVIDRKSKTVLWKVSSSEDLRSVNTKRLSQEKVDQQMAELFESFPAK